MKPKGYRFFCCGTVYIVSMQQTLRIAIKRLYNSLLLNLSREDDTYKERVVTSCGIALLMFT